MNNNRQFWASAQQTWKSAWAAHVHGYKNEVFELLKTEPNLSGAEIGRRLGCSRETARKHKHHFQQSHEA